ncbi:MULTISPECIES: amidohydrolase [Roseivirga]|mgnify:CR=1 FL=1|uniref:amidohydrolase n=1 Tax=Roseivirga TaxID=290180 RepID=UPI000A4BFC72|nr:MULTISPECIES: amidohydrolase [Roseivirga]MBO6660519.1 amidohydrolase [Roseivirga sp.]MBO6760179.1 amidohydrolase [Roseivirga sp.]MBO6906744.1 amidohydrolase [Roseivirga sp.]WPZ09152.1 amidohydrolase family protein [Roseivirga spongicola]
MLEIKNSLKGLLAGLILLLSACSSGEKADSIFYNGSIYTVDDSNPQAEAVAVKDGMIMAVGSSSDIMKYQGDETEMVDLNGQTMTPGFIESHAHMMGVGYNKLELDLMYVKTYDELVAKVAEAVEKAQPGDWITGRGWHQDKWIEKPDNMVKGFQTHDKMSAVSPDNPVWLRHASGHAAFGNAKAMELAGVNNLSIESLQGEVEGGEIIKDELGNPTGVFTERAASIIGKLVPAETEERAEQALQMAIDECLRLGITSFHDAGSGQDFIDRLQKFKDQGKLKVRMYTMLTGRQPSLLEEWYEKGPMIDPDHLHTVRSIKLNCDGALGPRGAWLLEEYTDRPGHYGHETLPMETVTTVSEKALASGFQVCSHAIGDRANREILDRYEAAFDKYPDVDRKAERFRIEHAQHLSEEDIARFGEMNIVAAMQAIHMSSDRPWAIDRLGEERIVEGAYVWQKLMDAGAVVCNGTDAPVEPLDPLPSFYASISRKTLDGFPEGGFEADQAMTRAQALKSYTLDGAYAEFEEDFKGSIEVGKAADFTIFDKNIMTVPEQEILKAKATMTVVGGEIVFRGE